MTTLRECPDCEADRALDCPRCPECGSYARAVGAERKPYTPPAVVSTPLGCPHDDACVRGASCDGNCVNTMGAPL